MARPEPTNKAENIQGTLAFSISGPNRKNKRKHTPKNRKKFILLIIILIKYQLAECSINSIKHNQPMQKQIQKTNIEMLNTFYDY